jgi:hypothetical protein
MTPREVLNRALFRGARIEHRTLHHIRLELGGRRTTVPMYGELVPVRTIRRIEVDLGLDLKRPIRAHERAARRR